jgi:Fe-S cluster assembly ATP-binding protein
MLEVRNLRVSSKGKEIIKGVSFFLRPGTVTVIMGPNGSGKSSLCNALMGDPAFRARGSMKLGGSELIRLRSDARARKGIFLAFQNPEDIEGVKISNFIRKAVAARPEAGRPSAKGKGRASRRSADDLDALMKSHERLLAGAEKLGIDRNAVTRELNVGFSGGEKKRLEALQMLMLKPAVIILDEIDSGLDVDGLKLVARAINSLRDGKRSFLLVTHYPRILRYLAPDAVHVLVGGRLVRSGTAKLAHEIEKKGYAPYLKKAGMGQG